MSGLINKIFGNSEIPDLPFPEIPPHDHNGANSPVLAPSSIDSIQIKAGAVVTESLADNSVGSDKIIDDAILTEHINALAVTQQKLADAAVATSKIQNGAVNASKLIQSEAVITVSAQIAEAIILSAHIGTGAIQNANLGNAIITTAKIVDLAVNTAKIADASVEWAKIASASVGNSKIMTAAISTAKIQDEAVGTAQIATGSITNALIANASITNAKIADLSVDNAKIASISASKINSGSMSAGYIYGGIGYFDSINIAMCGLAALNVAGNINKTGTCNFCINHPLKPGQRLIYTGMESAEVLLATRGTAKLQNGRKTIVLPDHFKAVSDRRGVSAYVTPRQSCGNLYIEQADNGQITICEAGGKSNAEFDYLVISIRSGFYDYDFEPEGELLIEAEQADKTGFRQKFDEFKNLKQQGNEVIFKDQKPVPKTK